MSRVPNRRQLAALIYTVSIFAGIAVSGQVARGQQTSSLTKSKPPEWRSFRTVWQHQVRRLDGNFVEDMLCERNCIYYSCNSHIACLNKKTGAQIWNYSFAVNDRIKKDQSGGYSRGDGWQLASEGDLILTVNKESSRVIVLNALTGKTAWERVLKSEPVDKPILAGRSLIILLADGSISAFNAADGKPLWSKRFITGNGPQNGGLPLRATPAMVIAQIDGSRLVAFNARTGTQMWDYYPNGTKDRRAPMEFAIKDGLCYAESTTNGKSAIDIVTGKRLWNQKPDGPGPSSHSITILSDQVFNRPDGSSVTSEYPDGATVWRKAEMENLFQHVLGPIALPWHHDEASCMAGHVGIFNVQCELPLVNGVQRRYHSIDSINTLVMVDARTGNERWKWQPDDGFRINTVLSDGDLFFVSDGDSIMAARPGRADDTTLSQNAKRNLAQYMVASMFGHEKADPLWLPASLRTRIGFWRPTDAEANLTLLKLGPVSVGPLLDFARHSLTETDQYYSKNGRPLDLGSPEVASDFRIGNQLTWNLEVICDIRDKSCVPVLIDLLNQTKDPQSRQSLATALIRFGDYRAAPALFRYAQSIKDSSHAQLYALYWLCRLPDSVIPQKQMTDYLLACLAHPMTPAWRRRFARFELLNNRGDEALKAALASFEGETIVPILPKNLTLTEGTNVHIVRNFADLSPKGFPREVHIISQVQSHDGKRWGAFLSNYLGDENDVWIVRSSDGKNWTDPRYAINLTQKMAPGARADKFRFHGSQDGLIFDWDEINYSVKPAITQHHDSISFVGLTRDSDGDGLTDLLEQRLGSDPQNKSTNGDGALDSETKNPGYHPHHLNDDEAIYQAAVEAMCQVGRAQLEAKQEYSFPILFGGCNAPLVLYLPPGSSGVKILGHPGPVVCRKLLPTHGIPVDNFLGASMADCYFTAPHIDFHGASSGRQSEPEWRRFSPFADSATTRKAASTVITWREYFPYVLSTDGKSARVGWEENQNDFEHPSRVGYDIEVKKVGDQWLPVQCRKVTASGRLTGMVGMRDDSVVVVPDVTPR